MIILGIETSCDDTAAALIEEKNSKILILKNIIYSQSEIHKKYGGIVPEVAAREHVETIIPVIKEATEDFFKKEKRTNKNHKIDAIAVTSGPGLATSLHVGVETAKSLSLAWEIPIIGVNHIEGHIYSVLLPYSKLKNSAKNNKIKFPAIALIVSGGHTELIMIKKEGHYSLLGRTRDDAAGEAFDKSAKMLGLSYPGGPIISKLAEKGNPYAFKIPRPMIERKDFELSFSGMKNAIRLLIQKSSNLQKENTSLKEGAVKDMCASIEQAIVDVLVSKSIRAVSKYKPKTFIVAGGVSANKKLRKSLENRIPRSAEFLYPKTEYCMDNAAMIAVAALKRAKNKNFDKPEKISANSNWELV